MPADQPISRNRDDYESFAKVLPRFSDQDTMQHINNVAIAAYLEAGRVGLLMPVLEACDGTGIAMVLGRVTIDFLGELHFPDEVEVAGRFVAMGNRSLTSHYAVFQNGACCVVSQAVNVFFDKAQRQSAPPPDPVAAMIRAQLADRPSR